MCHLNANKIKVLGEQRQENCSKFNANLETLLERVPVTLVPFTTSATSSGADCIFLWSLKVLLGSSMQGHSVSDVL